MKNNSCLMIAVLAIIAIFICYCCNGSSFRSKFDGIQPDAAKWAHNMGMMGYGDNPANIQQVLNDSRMIGMGTNPVAGIPNAAPHPAASPYYPQINHPDKNIDSELKAMEHIMERKFHINPKTWRTDDISKANDPN
jgi:hypothetical protein